MLEGPWRATRPTPAQHTSHIAGAIFVGTIFARTTTDMHSSSLCMFISWDFIYLFPRIMPLLKDHNIAQPELAHQCAATSAFPTPVGSGQTGHCCMVIMALGVYYAIPLVQVFHRPDRTNPLLTLGEWHPLFHQGAFQEHPNVMPATHSWFHHPSRLCTWISE